MYLYEQTTKYKRHNNRTIRIKDKKKGEKEGKRRTTKESTIMILKPLHLIDKLDINHEIFNVVRRKYDIRYKNKKVPEANNGNMTYEPYLDRLNMLKLFLSLN